MKITAVLTSKTTNKSQRVPIPTPGGATGIVLSEMVGLEFSLPGAPDSVSVFTSDLQAADALSVGGSYVLSIDSPAQ